MIREHIRLFVLERLKKCSETDVIDMQQYLLGLEEVGVAVDANEIDFVLENMSFAQELLCVSGYKHNRSYKKMNSNQKKDYSNKIVAIDIDDVCAELTDRWLGIYNAEHGDSLIKEDITKWEIGSFTKIGNKFYEYLSDKALYDHVELVPGALKGIKRIKGTGARVIFITAGIHPGKFDFLVRTGAIEHKEDYVIAYDKSLILADVLVDDKHENVKNFPGYGILFDKPWNRSHNDVTRAIDWEDVILILFGRNKKQNIRTW